MSSRPESFQTEATLATVMVTPLIIMFVLGQTPLPLGLMGRILWVLGPITAVIWLVCLVIGLKIAYGIGPAWMARTHRGVRILEKVAFNPESGSQVLSDLPPADAGYKFYLRVRLENGVTEEYRTCRRTFASLHRGQAGHAKTLGRRLLEFRPLPPEPGLEIIDRD